MFKTISNFLLFSTISLISLTHLFLVPVQAEPEFVPEPDCTVNPDDPDCSKNEESNPNPPNKVAPEPPEPPVVSTNVLCVTDSTTNYIPTTVISKGNKGTSDYRRAVLITWKTTEFGENYTPRQRCNIVSSKFNSAVQANGGELRGISLTNGPVNNQIVVCALRPGEEECSSENMLFTLKKENERRAGAILGRLLNISVTGSGSVIEENSGQQIKVDMGAWASRNLRRTGNAVTNNRNTPTTPSNRRRPVNNGF